jgi:hypothetical protein
MGYLVLGASDFQSRFYQVEANQPTIAHAREPMHNIWLNFTLKPSVLESTDCGKASRLTRLQGEVQNAVVESLQVVLPEGSQVEPFVHVQSTLHWRACHSVGCSYDIDNRTEHHHTFSGPVRLGLLATLRPSDSVWVPPENLFFVNGPFGTDKFYAQELKDEMQRIPPALYRKLVKHRPDERLHDFPWLSTAYRMAEYLLTRNEPLRKKLMPVVQRSCQTVDAKYTLDCAGGVWSDLASRALIQEVNYQLFILQVVSRWPNFRLHYRIIPENDQAAAEEGWILPQQLRCFAYEKEPFWSLIGLLAQYSPERTIQLRPHQNKLHYWVGRWLLQYSGKIQEQDGYSLFGYHVNVPITARIRLKFYL